MENKTMFSFIIPHKNTPDLLQKCLDSIPRRDDVQIIVVDDNSDPDKVDFDHFPGLDDSTVEVYLTKEGRGAGYARNIGLEHAVGKWLVFADADDFFNECIAEVLDTYSVEDFDIALWKTNCINVDTGRPGGRGKTLNEAFSEAQNKDYANVLLISTPCKGMYSARVIKDNNIKFNECRWANDVVFSSKVAVSVDLDRVRLIDMPVYCITEHTNYGLVSKPSLESHIVRFQQECQNAQIVKHSRFCHNNLTYYWCFRSWFDIYKEYGKKEAVKLLPYALKTVGWPFLREGFKSKFK